MPLQVSNPPGQRHAEARMVYGDGDALRTILATGQGLQRNATSTGNGLYLSDKCALYITIYDLLYIATNTNGLYLSDKCARLLYTAYYVVLRLYIVIYGYQRLTWQVRAASRRRAHVALHAGLRGGVPHRATCPRGARRGGGAAPGAHRRLCRRRRGDAYDGRATPQESGHPRARARRDGRGDPRVSELRLLPRAPSARGAAR